MFSGQGYMKLYNLLNHHRWMHNLTDNVDPDFGGRGGEEQIGGQASNVNVGFDVQHQSWMQYQQQLLSQKTYVAYTNELENKVSRLEEENRRLKSMKGEAVASYVQYSINGHVRLFA